jgi:predicted MPP superfamily phosphohydrolase
MDTQKFIPYLIVISSILIFFDYIVIRSWVNYIWRWQKKEILKRISWILFFTMIIMSGIALYLRIQNHQPNEFIKLFYMISAIWYLPKLVIAPFLLLKFLVNLIKLYINKLRKIEKKEQIDKSNENRRKFLETTGWALAGVPFLVIGNGVLRTTQHLEIKYVDVLIKNLPFHLDGLKIAQISDIHAGSFYSPKLFAETIYLINSHKPDLVCITGDFVNFHPDELPLIYDDLKKIESNYGTFACLGNHDHYMKPEDHQELIKLIRQANIDLLINENRTLNIQGAKIQIAGCDNNSFRQNFADFDKTFSGLNNSDAKILLCHDPSNWDRFIKRKLNVDLTLSGHTHGGQVSFEFAGKEFLTPVKYMYKYVEGLYTDVDEHLYINSGLGTSGPLVRIGVKPELTIINLKAPSNLA